MMRSGSDTIRGWFVRAGTLLAWQLALLAVVESAANAQGPPPSVLASPAPAAKEAPAGPPLEGPAVDDTPLLLERLPPDLEWYHGHYWMPPDIWSGSFEIGINGSEGNAQSFSMRVGGNVKRKTDSNQFEAKFTHAKTSSNGIDTQNNALFFARDEILFGESPWSLFGQTNLEYDEFKAFDLRLVANGGVGYQFLKSDITKLKGRFGAGTSREFGGPDNAWNPEGVFGLEYERKLTERQKLSAIVEYYPVWDNFEDYRIVTNVAWEVLLDEASNLNLKIGVIDRYDNTPHGRLPNDVDYSLLLMWKL